MFEDLNNELSNYLKFMRFKHKLSQEDMANLLNVTRNTYSIWEKKPTNLSLETLIKIGDSVGEDICIFFADYVAKSNENNL